MCVGPNGPDYRAPMGLIGLMSRVGLGNQTEEGLWGLEKLRGVRGKGREAEEL